jgi:hypothetical protein
MNRCQCSGARRALCFVVQLLERRDAMFLVGSYTVLCVFQTFVPISTILLTPTK